MSERLCERCGSPLDKTQKRFCSRACWHEEMKQRVTCTCEICGKDFDVPKSRAERWPTKYCSRTCAGKGHTQTMMGRGRQRVELVCEQCGKPYEVIPSWVETSRFCSYDCMNEWKRSIRGEDHPLKVEYVKKTCEFCGVAYEVKPSEAHKSRFCSRRCGGSWRIRNMHLPTSIETAIASLLDDLNIPYESEHQIGYFLCDFYIPDAKLVIECDGTYWHGRSSQIRKDKRKDSWLRNKGYAVLRLPEELIRNDIAGCQQLILGLRNDRVNPASTTRVRGRNVSAV